MLVFCKFLLASFAAISAVSAHQTPGIEARAIPAGLTAFSIQIDFRDKKHPGHEDLVKQLTGAHVTVGPTNDKAGKDVYKMYVRLGATHSGKEAEQEYNWYTQYGNIYYDLNGKRVELGLASLPSSEDFTPLYLVPNLMGTYVKNAKGEQRTLVQNDGQLKFGDSSHTLSFQVYENWVAKAIPGDRTRMELAYGTSAIAKKQGVLAVAVNLKQVLKPKP